MMQAPPLNDRSFRSNTRQFARVSTKFEDAREIAEKTDGLHEQVKATTLVVMRQQGVPSRFVKTALPLGLLA